MDVVVETQVKHTESKEKVAAAVSNLFKVGELRVEADRVVFTSEDIESLRFLKDQLRDRRVRSAARRLLLSNSKEGSFQTFLLLNKQAATVGVAALCDDPGESALGPIVLRIKSAHLQDVITWLTFGYEGTETS
ncbi:MAG: hypothetical protein M1378_13855 [Bacteroidetes bacterium]|nr:hypothetical protein [Bacteroidota bacterium]